MSTVVEILEAISSLAPEDYASIRDWFVDRDSRLWDAQIEEDSASGRLNHLVQEIEADIASGKIKSLDEVIGDS
ncbi:MAG: hypothetical protein V4507_13225 [Verrucomicrobiota bacterium]